MVSAPEGLRPENSQSSTALIDTVVTEMNTFLEVHPMSFLTQGLRPHPKTLASTQGEASKGHKAVC